MTLARTTTRAFLLCCALFGATNPAEAFSAMEPSVSKPAVASSSRRDWLGNVGGMAALVATSTVVVGLPQGAFAASSDEYVDELKTSLTKLQPIPKLLEEQKWDEARTILKTSPVNKLWNLGDSQNTVSKLVKETGNVELFEMKDDLAYNLQMCDQFAYANNFISFQPGNGKLKLKEPIEVITKAMGQLETIIKESS
mmetsp:Transcript_13128/g.27175  ORF Transcript_13128/g.27175 Transcript_13128/m.27175 type:complete len:197 (-) Transcript_13128:117-707(-)|eukprot:CAMPEP_0197265122 /NCGR_PEP_ID=MMETSP1432-20130617/2212_1 /TAXON_ID=44447 /ORGANISM="Pseudo-nitzschia delicatissima, Strain UNC1205" /LENGTH=196 /DNA_ID=CAMNT_0042729837 /DNA_START=52 /DNA_END=638 /DNA_ORIENTATION=+